MRNATLEPPTSQKTGAIDIADIKPSIIAHINRAIATGSAELVQEGEARNSISDQHTIASRNLCPSQGRNAARTWRDGFRA